MTRHPGALVLMGVPLALIASPSPYQDAYGIRLRHKVLCLPGHPKASSRCHGGWGGRHLWYQARNQGGKQEIERAVGNQAGNNERVGIVRKIEWQKSTAGLIKREK